MGALGRLVECDERLPWARGADGAICDGDGDVLGAAAGGVSVDPVTRVRPRPPRPRSRSRLCGLGGIAEQHCHEA